MLSIFKSITTFVFDVDGVLTDGTLFLLGNGEQVRRMHIKDGFALQLAIKKGYQVIVISGSESEAVRDRLGRLGITDVHMRIQDKSSYLASILVEREITPEKVLFMGDDIPDYSVMKTIGLPCAPADAAPEVRQIARYISDKPGGMGCVRDVIEKVLKLNGHWELDTNLKSL